MTPAEWSAILIALISAGLLKYAVDFIRWLKARQDTKAPEVQRHMALSTVDQSLAIVAKARDELEADNARLRREAAEDRERYEADRARWDGRERTLREEIDALERKLKEILREIESIKARTTSMGPPSNPALRAPR